MIVVGLLAAGAALGLLVGLGVLLWWVRDFEPWS